MRLFLPPDSRGVMPVMYFHAMARLGVEGAVIVSPRDTFVSVGYFDHVPTIIDQDYCARQGITVCRRETGGGAVLLGPGQTFYQLVLSKRHPWLRGTLEARYRFLSRIPVAAYRSLGVETRYAPVNDLITLDGRKVAGQGAADIGACFCWVGNLLGTFDVDAMCRVLRFPDPGVGEKVRQAMDRHMSWVARERGEPPSRVQRESVLREAFDSLLGPLEPHPMPEEVTRLAYDLAKRFTSRACLGKETARIHRATKIREGVYVPWGETCKS